jgi:putative phage-type endonuclease
MIIHENMQQGSDDWLQLRLGKITASRIKDVMSNGRNDKPSVTSKSYMVELVADILKGEPSPFYESKSMQWGTETEPQACAMYELKEDVDVRHVAFIEANDFLGVSPDGLVGKDGMLEIKCPNTTTQIKRFIDNVGLPSDYKPQVQCQLWVSEREWCDFVSFDPRIDVNAGYIRTRVYRDDDYISLMNKKVCVFIEEMKAMISLLTGE